MASSLVSRKANSACAALAIATHGAGCDTETEATILGHIAQLEPFLEENR